MEYAILVVGVINLVATFFLWRRERTPINIQWIPITAPEENQPDPYINTEITEIVIEPTDPHPQTVATDQNQYSAWVNRKGVPISQVYDKPEPPVKKVDGERPYGWA